MIKAGTIGLVQFNDLPGKLIRLGQRLNGADKQDARWTHALIAIGDGTIVQAESGGVARGTENSITPYTVMWWFPPIASDAQGRAAADFALKSVGALYSWIDYFAVAAKHFHMLSLTRDLDRQVDASKRMICSQLVDAAYLNAGVHLFDDGRRPGDVTPADLAHLTKIL